MSQPILQFVAGNQPIFNMEYAILSAPVRHVFMIATVWYLTKEKQHENMQVLEIGSWVGASALSWAQGLELHNGAKGTITCVDAWKPFFNRETHQDDVYVKMEQALTSETAYHLFSHNVSTLPKTIICQHLRGQSNHILPLLQEKTFDIVFIDGDHAYTPALKDIKNSLRLVKDGGIICGDDLNLQLSEVDKENILKHAEDDFIKDPKTNRNCHPGVTLAVAEVFGEVSMWGGFWAMQKRGETWHKISLKDMPVHYPNHFPESALKRAEDHLNDIVIT
ncbi:MAG: class I SAM-dependent methyltransferase [Gammaproteobacteria bacterium]|nr:class I SAM-dependent methyltransferase [Gammaproteobacteria bacterium]MCW5583860.1 class I SAM-dependent methyltransferase [Gammaproteobacteria bacterium]